MFYRKFILSLICRTVALTLLLISFSILSFSQPQQESILHLEEKEILKYDHPDPDSLSQKIRELHHQAELQSMQGDMAAAIRFLQLGLLLQERLPAPTPAGFDLYVFAGNIIGTLDKRYGLEFFKKSCEMVPYLGDESAPGIFSLYATRAGCHYELQEPDTALMYHRKAILMAKKLDRTSGASARNNLGVFYHDTQQYDSAYFHFREALELLGDRKNHMGLFCAIQDNIAQLELVKGNYTAALSTFQYNDLAYDSLQNHQKYMTNKIRLLETMAQLRMSGIHDQITSMISFTQQHRLQLQARDVLNFFQFAAEWYASQSDHRGQIRMQEKYIALSDSLSKTASEQLHLVSRSILNLQEASFLSDMEVNKLAAEKTRLKLENTRRTLLISVLSGISILILTWLYFRARRLELSAQKHLAETELDRKKMESKLMEQELALKERDLTNMVLHNTQVYDSNQKMIERLEQISRQKTEVESEVRSMLVDLQSQNQISDRSIGLLTRIEDVNEAFYDRLHTKFPNLTKSESELCGYLRINLSNKDISVLKNVEAASVKMSKNRLRKKLGITPEEDLYAFIRMV